MSRRPSASRPSTRPARGSASSSPRPRRETAAEPELLGLRAVVTGASSGIGRAIALELAAGGAEVLVSARASREEADETARRIRKLYRGMSFPPRRGASPPRSHQGDGRGGGSVVMADLSTPAGCDELLEAAWRRLERVDIWVNNAGADILTGEGWKLDFEEKLDRLLSVDVLATVRLSRAAGQRMRAAGGGVILNMGWDGARTGLAGDSGELFATTKAAIMGFSTSLALSLAPEVRVNCLAPGWIRTRWGEGAPAEWNEKVIRETPLGRWGTPEDVARAARFLASPAASFMTGQVIAVNGGAARW